MLHEEVARSHAIILHLLRLRDALEVQRCTWECLDLIICQFQWRLPARLARIAVRWCSEEVGKVF